MKKNPPTSISSNSTPEEIQAFLKHQGMTAEDLQRMLNGMFGGHFRNQFQLPGLPFLELEETHMDQAMELIDKARNEVHASKKQRNLLKKAIKICPDCADAYCLLATTLTNPEERLDLLKQAVEAGERFAGSDAFQQDVGHFWGILETRPYMRARQQLAEHFWQTGEQQDAIAHYQDMLRLNPNDNQGLRYTLLAWLMETNRISEANALLTQYSGDAQATWLYSKTLLSFREEGNTKKSQDFLQKAYKKNRYILEYLNEPSRIPDELPNCYAIGSEEEALFYLNDHLPAWKNTPDALNWVRETGLIDNDEKPKNKLTLISGHKHD